MHTRELHVTIRLDHELSGVRAEAILRDGDHAPVVGVGEVRQQRSDPFSPREDLAVVAALRALADALVADAHEAHPCAPEAVAAAERAAPAGDNRPAPRGPTLPEPRNGRARVRSRASRPVTSRGRR